MPTFSSTRFIVSDGKVIVVISLMLLLPAGRVPVDDPEQVIQHFGGTHISPDYLANNMFQLSDLFSVPQVCNLWLDTNNIHLTITDGRHVFSVIYSNTLKNTISGMTRRMMTGTICFY